MTFDRPRHESAPKAPYLWATVAILALGVGCTLAILALRPNADPLIVITAVMGVMLSTGAGVGSILKGHETGLTFNGRMTEMIANAVAAGRAEGIEQGRQDEEARWNAKPVVPILGVSPNVNWPHAPKE